MFQVGPRIWLWTGGPWGLRGTSWRVLCFTVARGQKRARPAHPRWFIRIAPVFRSALPRCMLRFSGAVVPCTAPVFRSKGATVFRSGPLRFSGGGFCFSFGREGAPDFRSTLRRPRFQVIATRIVLAKADAVPFQEVHSRHVLHALARRTAQVRDLCQPPERSLALAFEAETAGLHHDNEAVVLQFAEP